MSYAAEQANSAPQNPLDGFEGPLSGGGKKGEMKGRRVMEGKNFWIQPCEAQKQDPRF